MKKGELGFPTDIPCVKGAKMMAVLPKKKKEKKKKIEEEKDTIVSRKNL